MMSVAWSPDGSQVVSGSRDKTVRVWDAGTGECVRRLRGHSSGVVNTVAWSGGSKVASGSADKTVRVWARGHGGSACGPWRSTPVR